MDRCFVSDAPIVRLVNAFAEPFNNAVATARTCYASRVITPADVSRDAAARARRDAIAQSTYEAGHHTTLQHATFQFVLENVSRQFVWSFLHAHPHYNSEQVSQRYVAVKADRVLVPALAPWAEAIYRQTVAAQMQCYRDLVELLTPDVATAYFNIFAARQKHADKHAGDIQKKAQEIARYALPIATFAHLYHTVSGITLHRYNRLANMLDVPSETGLVVGAMIQAVTDHDPLFFARIEDPIPLEQTHEYQALVALHAGSTPTISTATAFRTEFDHQLQGSYAQLLDYSAQGESILARAVRTTLGITSAVLNDDMALALALSPAKNPYLAGSLNLSAHAKITRALAHVHYTFQKKLSHCADSQDQRHRTTLGTRPLLQAHYIGGVPDVVVPPLLANNAAAYERFMETMTQTWQAIDTLLTGGTAAEMALYLLPNAFPIRFEQSGNLLGFHHKWTTRLCYNAQEEIWRASLDEVKAVAAVHPRIGRYLQPPCGVRAAANKRPVCPEGTRFCGVPVWKQDRQAYLRVI